MDYRFTENEYNLYKILNIKQSFLTPEEEYNYSKNIYKMCKQYNINKCINNFNKNTSGTVPFDKNGYRLRRPECSICTKK